MTDKDFTTSAFECFGPKLVSGVSPADVFHELRLMNQPQMACLLGPLP